MEKKRNQGIDLLRMIAMFMIVTLHVSGAGGMLDASDILSVNGAIAWFLEIMAYCAVNCGEKGNFQCNISGHSWAVLVFHSVFLYIFLYSFFQLYAEHNATGNAAEDAFINFYSLFVMADIE